MAPRAHARCWSSLDRSASLSARGLHLDIRLREWTSRYRVRARAPGEPDYSRANGPIGPAPYGFQGPFGHRSQRLSVLRRRSILEHRAEQLEHACRGPQILSLDALESLLPAAAPGLAL